MFRLWTTLAALLALPALTDIPELPPFDEGEIDDIFDRLAGGDSDNDDGDDDEEAS
jgi:hypothetical protein